MKRLLIAAALWMAAPVVAYAQDAHRMEVYGGYQMVRYGSDEVKHLFNESLVGHGFVGAVEGRINDRFSIVGEYGFFRKGDDILDGSIKEMTFMGGPRVSYRADQLRVFGHFLLGGYRLSASDELGSYAEFVLGKSSQTGFGMAFGGGLDYALNKNISIRPTQFDILATRFGDGLGWQNAIRWSAGVVYKF